MAINGVVSWGSKTCLVRSKKLVYKRFLEVLRRELLFCKLKFGTRDHFCRTSDHGQGSFQGFPQNQEKRVQYFVGLRPGIFFWMPWDLWEVLKLTSQIQQPWTYYGHCVFELSALWADQSYLHDQPSGSELLLFPCCAAISLSRAQTLN